MEAEAQRRGIPYTEPPDRYCEAGHIQTRHTHGCPVCKAPDLRRIEAHDEAKRTGRCTHDLTAPHATDHRGRCRACRALAELKAMRRTA